MILCPYDLMILMIKRSTRKPVGVQTRSSYIRRWHGISKNYEVVTESIDKLRLQLTRTSDCLYYVLIYR